MVAGGMSGFGGNPMSRRLNRITPPWAYRDRASPLRIHHQIRTLHEDIFRSPVLPFLSHCRDYLRLRGWPLDAV